MQSGTVTDINAVVDNCSVALQEAEEMAGFRPTQCVIGIAGELVKGFTTTHSQERKRADAPITDAELQKLIDGVQREALREAERAITWETGLPQVDVRLVHAAVTGAQIDGYPVTNPVGFQGRHVKISVFNAFAPLVHLGALQTVAQQLELELLEIVAEPYAVARVLASEQVQQSGALFVDIGGGTTDVALVRTAASKGRACSPWAAGHSPSPSPTGWICRSRGPRSEAGLRARPRSWSSAPRWPDRRRRRGHLGGRRGAGDGRARRRRSPAGAHLPLRRRLASAGDRGHAPERGVLEAPAVQPAAGGRRHGPDQVERIKDGTHLLVDQQDVTPLGLAYQAIELQTNEDPLDIALRRVLRAMKM
jgi:cell division protein FtsA